MATALASEISGPLWEQRAMTRTRATHEGLEEALRVDSRRVGPAGPAFEKGVVSTRWAGTNGDVAVQGWS